MQKRMKWLLALFIPVLLGIGILCSLTQFGGAHASPLPKARITVLAAGVDLAAEHTDVLMLLSLDLGEKRVTVLQIPRDTYFSSDTPQHKINQLYPHYRLSGHSPVEALSAVAGELSLALGVTIDHVMVIDLATAAKIVDAMGGVSLTVPVAIRQAIPGTDRYVELAPGYRTLNGEEAVAFLRYRAGYTEGDLGRINAQKLLLDAVYKKLKAEVPLSLLLDLIRKGGGGIQTDIPLSAQWQLATACYSVRKDLSLLCATLPGEAARGEIASGIWYYVVNKQAAATLLRRYFASEAFDPDVRMLDPARAHFQNIYYDKNFSYSVTTG